MKYKLQSILNVTFAICFIYTISLTQSAHAYLGGFENVDGYRPFLDDVANYNAGAHGVNAGGGAYSTITPNSGQWVKLQGSLIPATGTTGAVSYATGHQNVDRLNPSTAAQGLVITTNADGWTAGPQEYSYAVDSFDLAGVNPLTTGATTVDISFWSCAQIVGSNDPNSGLGAGTIGDTVSFYDSSGNLGFSVGYRQPGITTDFAATNVGSWVQSAVAVNPSTYHRWDISLDLLNDTVSIDIFEGTTLTNLVSGAPLVNNMGDLSELRFESTAGVNNAKIWSLDDFGFDVRQIPEPSSVVLMVGAVICTLARRRRR